jgi:large subunit ribosomal protein L17
VVLRNCFTNEAIGEKTPPKVISYHSLVTKPVFCQMLAANCYLCCEVNHFFKKNSIAMRHGKKHNHLGRTSAHRKALLSNLAISLIEHKRINTTLAKAKALRRFIEPLVTKAKSNTTHCRRVVFSHLQNKAAVTELFSTIAEKTGDRPGGYVRVIRTVYRKGDAAEMALIEFVDFNPDYYGQGKPEAEEGTSKDGGKRRRRRRGGKGAKSSGTAEAATATAAATEEVAEPAVEEAPEAETSGAEEEE